MIIQAYFKLSVLAVLVVLTVQTRAAFIDEVREATSSEVFQAAAKQAEALLEQDKLDEANLVYIHAIPDDKQTPAQVFVLGNTFFSMDAELALKYHRRALNLMPDEPHVNLELAMDLHRMGKPQEAIPHYEKCIAASETNYLPHVLLADCLIRTGKLKEAVAQWKLADHPHNHTGIDFAIHSIYGEDSPFKRRDNLLKAIQQGEVSKLDELTALSASWDRDWWNSETNGDMLKRDLALAKKLLSADPARLAELELFAQTYEEELEPKPLEKALKTGKWILGPDATLPLSPYAADRFVALVIEQQLDDEASLLKRFEKELRKRSLEEGGKDVMALNMLAHLLAGAGEERAGDLAEVDRAGWDKYHDERFAASLLTRLLATKKLKTDSPLYLQAVKEFPEDEPIALMGVAMAKEEGKSLLEALVAAIKAEFRHLSMSQGVIKDSYRLKALFSMLEEELKKQV